MHMKFFSYSQQMKNVCFWYLMFLFAFSHTFLYWILKANISCVLNDHSLMPHIVSCPLYSVFITLLHNNWSIASCFCLFTCVVQAVEGIQELVIVYAGGKWSCEDGKIHMLHKILYDYINVFSEYYISLLSLFVKKYKYFVLLHV